jgi:hypothetical protein
LKKHLFYKISSLILYLSYFLFTFPHTKFKMVLKWVLSTDALHHCRYLVLPNQTIIDLKVRCSAAMLPHYYWAFSLFHDPAMSLLVFIFNTWLALVIFNNFLPNFFRPCFIADLLLISCLVLLDKKSHSRYWWWQNDHLVIISALKGRVIGALEAWKFLHKPNF